MGVTGDGISQNSTNDSDFGNYYDTGKQGTQQYQLVQDILKAAKAGKIENGTYIDFNYGAVGVGNELYVYYNGYFYPTKYRWDKRPSGVTLDNIIGRGARVGQRTKYIDPNDL